MGIQLVLENINVKNTEFQKQTFDCQQKQKNSFNLQARWLCKGAEGAIKEEIVPKWHLTTRKLDKTGKEIATQLMGVHTLLVDAGKKDAANHC